MSLEEENKDTWLRGKLLLAMPYLGDPRFHKAVILMCAHDKNGAMGLVINHLLPGVDLSQLMGQLDIEISDAAQKQSDNFPVMSGGPVETARGFVLHGDDFNQTDTIEIENEIRVTGTIDALKAIAMGDGPQQMRFILGYSGWSAGQLDSEIKQNAWLVKDADPSLIFSDGEGDEMWHKAVLDMGIDPAMLSETAGRA